MRIAFYAPMKPPDHQVPSGDRRMARLLMQALRGAGHEVELASRLRSWEGQGDRRRQARIRGDAARLAERLIRRWRDAENRPLTARLVTSSRLLNDRSKRSRCLTVLSLPVSTLRL